MNLVRSAIPVLKVVFVTSHPAGGILQALWHRKLHDLSDTACSTRPLSTRAPSTGDMALLSTSSKPHAALFPKDVKDVSSCYDPSNACKTPIRR